MFTNPYHAPRVFVVAPDLSGWGLQRLIDSAHPAMELVGASTGIDGARQSFDTLSADVVLVDADEPHEIAALPLLATEGRRVILLTACVDEAVLDQAVLMGLRGVLRKTDTRELLLKAIDKVHGGQLWIDRSSTGRLFIELARQKSHSDDDPRLASLTMRERQTIEAIAVDSSAPAKVIADRLCISPHTLRNHLTSIYSKLGVTSRLDLYAYATRHRLSEQLTRR